MHVPLHTLARNKEIKAVSYVIMAASEDGSENQLVNLQDAEYKLAGFVKQFQWQYGSTACCHGAIGLWRRDVLGRKILWEHDTMFHGEDLYMGLLLHRLRKNYTIMVSAGAVVPTFAPPNMLILFRQRVSSWDVCTHRKWFTFVKVRIAVCRVRAQSWTPLMSWCRAGVCMWMVQHANAHLEALPAPRNPERRHRLAAAVPHDWPRPSQRAGPAARVRLVLLPAVHRNMRTFRCHRHDDRGAWCVTDDERWRVPVAAAATPDLQLRGAA